MKRKLFLFLVAFLALAGFQTKAADKILVGIHTGDSITTAGSMNNERGGYAGDVIVQPNKLTIEGNKFFYRKGTPKTNYGSPDRIWVENPSVNYVKFYTGPNGENPLTLSHSGVNYSQFVVFAATGTGNPPINTHVLDYYNTDQATPSLHPGQVLQNRLFNDGLFGGFLAIQATGMVDNGNLLIVVHNRAGEISLMAYKDYVATLGTNMATKTAGNQYYPLYIQTEKLSGRWARPSDFEDCKFYEFSTSDANHPNYTVGNKTIKVYNAIETEKGTTNTAFTVFSVRQVDYVADRIANPNNIVGSFTSGSGVPEWQGLNADFSGGYPTDYGTTLSDELDLRIIPLFVLSTPENNCQVLSISRQNDFRTQSQEDGVLASKLEVRPYGTYCNYYDAYGVFTGSYESHSPSCDEGNYAAYLSLQKFAIWINADGEFILYPAASYLWDYGDERNSDPAKDVRKHAADRIMANSCLVYNDIHARYIPTVTQADKAFGTQIGRWNGHRTNEFPNAGEQMTTIPNNLQFSTDYQERAFNSICKEDNASLAGRFYFLKVYVDTLGAWGSNPFFRRDGYNYGREYVLSTQLYTDPRTLQTFKRLVAVPKEEIRTSDKQYWRFPYDSVNMAAHWEIQAVTGGGYRMINMLGDTLKYNIENQLAYENFLAGGFLPRNTQIPGDINAVQAATPGNTNAASTFNNRYFGRPEHIKASWPWPAVQGDNTIHNWFSWNPILTQPSSSAVKTCDTWTFHKLKDGKRFGMDRSKVTPTPYGPDLFFMELNTPVTGDYSVGLVEGQWYQGGTNGSVGIEADRPQVKYYQKNIDLDFVSNNTFYDNCDVLPSCFGLLVERIPINYVPDHGYFYPGDRPTAETNTVDVGVNNTHYSKFQKQDSLTAYTFLEGTFDVKEVREVDNGLVLGYELKTTNSIRGSVNAARFVTDEKKSEIQFIPLSSPTGQARNAEIKNFPNWDNVDVLFNESYKWYLVYHAGLKKYLTFDTVNITAGTNMEKTGLVFEADLINSTPVRFYQPLVGDKKNSNFLIQFYVPVNKYKYGVSNARLTYQNTFPDIERTNSGIMYGGGEVCFANLSSQSDYIYATRAYNGPATGTRFTVVDKFAPVICDCLEEFITPRWMGEKRLLNLPMNNQVWYNGEVVNAWIAKNGAVSYVENTNKDKRTTLLHTYSGITITPQTTGTKGRLTFPAFGTAPTNLGAFNMDVFENDLNVPLYYIQNENLEYLTVVDKCDMHDPVATVPDVNAVKLEWRSGKLSANYYEASAPNRYYDYARQLFAIVACPEDQPDEDGQYGKFFYLPLASYVYNYATGNFETTEITGANGVKYMAKKISYNTGLGKALENSCKDTAADLTACWRISQYAASPVDDTKHLIVFNARGGTLLGNLTPLHFVLTRPQYEKPACLDVAVMNTGYKTGVYTLYDKISEVAGVNLNFNLLAHWNLKNPYKDDSYLYTFNPELQDVDGVTLGQKDAAGNVLVKTPTQLQGEYYFIKKLGDNRYQVMDVSGYKTAVTADQFAAKFDTLTLVCVDHEVPYYDLNVDSYTRLAILETVYTERNLASFYMNGSVEVMTPIYRNKSLYAYQGYVNKTKGETFEDADYVTVYPVNTKELSKDHVIPYYAFSVTKGGKEYFLNVDQKLNRPGKVGIDSVYWTAIDKDTRDNVLLAWKEDDQEFAFKTFKFCLPYRMNADGTLFDKVKYFNDEYQPVFLQTLDEGVLWIENSAGVATRYVDVPYLVIAGPATNYVTSIELEDAIKTVTSATKPTTYYGLELGLYSMDYRYIIQTSVTSWFFGGEIPGGNLWVPIWPAIADGSADGVLTDFTLGGAAFIDESGKTPLNYGTMTGPKNAPTLTVEYDGTNMIGTYAPVPIWYYRINLDDKFLTDASLETDGKYIYTFNGDNFKYAWFNEKRLDAYKPYETGNVFADQKFIQSFGFRYVTDDKDPNQAFYVVANANYLTNPVADFRYLAAINNQLVFVTDKADALIFQWGKLNGSEYTGLQVIGKAGIYGVEGGVKLLNTTGKVDLYSIDGRLITTTVLNGGETVIPASKGIVIVKNGTNVVKVAVQ